MTRFQKLTVPLVAGAGLILLANPGIAQDDEAGAEEPEIVVSGGKEIPRGYEKVSKKVRISDLDLTTETGTSEMEQRVGKAIDSICKAIKRKTVREYCNDYAWSDARPQMDRAITRASGG